MGWGDLVVFWKGFKWGLCGGACALFLWKGLLCQVFCGFWGLYIYTYIHIAF